MVFLVWRALITRDNCILAGGWIGQIIYKFWLLVIFLILVGGNFFLLLQGLLNLRLRYIIAVTHFKL